MRQRTHVDCPGCNRPLNSGERCTACGTRVEFIACRTCSGRGRVTPPLLLPASALLIAIGLGLFWLIGVSNHARTNLIWITPIGAGVVGFLIRWLLFDAARCARCRGSGIEVVGEPRAQTL